MKKIIAALLTTSLLFSPVGNIVFQDHTYSVEAKGYKSGKKSFNTNRSNTNTNSFFQKKQNNTTTNKSATTYKKRSGGFMKGMMVGGLAGLLFGSMFANMGFLGSILGFMINVIGIIILIAVIRKIFNLYMFKKRTEENNQWRR